MRQGIRVGCVWTRTATHRPQRSLAHAPTTSANAKRDVRATSTSTVIANPLDQFLDSFRLSIAVIMALMLALLLLASVPPAAADCSVMSPCGECGDDHCTIAGCPFRGFECNAQNDNQPDEVADTCRYNVIDPGYDGYA